MQRALCEPQGNLGNNVGQINQSVSLISTVPVGFAEKWFLIRSSVADENDLESVLQFLEDDPD